MQESTTPDDVMWGRISIFLYLVDKEERQFKFFIYENIKGMDEILSKNERWRQKEKSPQNWIQSEDF